MQLRICKKQLTNYLKSEKNATKVNKTMEKKRAIVKNKNRR